MLFPPLYITAWALSLLLNVNNNNNSTLNHHTFYILRRLSYLENIADTLVSYIPSSGTILTAVSSAPTQLNSTQLIMVVCPIQTQIRIYLPGQIIRKTNKQLYNGINETN